MNSKSGVSGVENRKRKLELAKMYKNYRKSSISFQKQKPMVTNFYTYQNRWTIVYNIMYVKTTI